MEFPLPGELEMIVHSGHTGPALPGLRRADSVTTQSWGAVLHHTVPTAPCCCGGGCQEKVRKRRLAFREGSHSPEPAF